MKRALALALIALPALPSAAAGAVSFEPTGPGAVSYRPGGEVVYRLRMRTGTAAERFRVELDQPRWGLGLVGAPLRPDDVTLQGPGALGDQSRGQASLARGVCLRGHAPESLSTEVALPPGATSTLVARFRLSADDAPFRGTDLRPTFLASGGTLVGEQRLRPAQPQLTGPFGVFLDLGTRPRTPITGNRPPRIRSGSALRLRGRARSVRRQVVDLRYVGPGTGSRSRRIARVRVDSRGGFGLRRFRPRRRGFYEVFATYRSQRSSLTSDRSCLRSFTVR